MAHIQTMQIKSGLRYDVCWRTQSGAFRQRRFKTKQAANQWLRVVEKTLGRDDQSKLKALSSKIVEGAYMSEKVRTVLIFPNETMAVRATSVLKANNVWFSIEEQATIAEAGQPIKRTRGPRKMVRVENGGEPWQPQLKAFMRYASMSLEDFKNAMPEMVEKFGRTPAALYSKRNSLNQPDRE